VIGHFCSNPTLEAAKLYDKAGVTLLAPSAALPALTESGLSTVIRMTTRLDAQGAFAAKRILAKRPDARLAVVDDGSVDMKAITASFATAYGKPITVTASIVPDQKDFADVIVKLKAANIDTLYLATNGSDAGRITAVAAKAGLDLKRYGPDSLLIDTFWAASGADGENTLVSFPADPQNSFDAKALSRDSKALGQATEGPFIPAYAAVQLFAAAAGQAGPHSKAKIAETLKSGESFSTVLGPLSFDGKGDGQDLRFNWYSWNNGVYQTIAPEN
jgi:branched-chain amino acid transport system substrate-binding protein